MLRALTAVLFRISSSSPELSSAHFVSKTPPAPRSTPSASMARRMGSIEPTCKNVCLTMHQPWASLLVAGVKRVEGRSWHTDHRGKLWIHASAREPGAEEVRTVEDQYRAIYAAEGITGELYLPTSYPTSCLLGCVEIVDCLPQAHFQATESIPLGAKMESQSDFVFLCQAPRQLVLPFRLPGHHKLWKMDKHTREAAEQGLGPVVNGPLPLVFPSR